MAYGILECVKVTEKQVSMRIGVWGMIKFTTKKTLVIDKKLLCFREGQTVYTRIQYLFQKNNCEIILIYEGNRYCGYIESSDMCDIVVPERYLGYNPVELTASKGLMEEIEENLQTVQKQVFIPIKGFETDTTRVFAFNNDDNDAMLTYLKRYSELDNPKFLLEKFKDKKIVQLPELNEFTYVCYKILERKKQGILVEGHYWKYINVYNKSYSDIREADILEYNYMNIINLLEQMVKVKISEELEYLCRKGIQSYKVIIPAYNELKMHGEVEEKIKKEIGISIEVLRNKDFPNRRFWIDKFMQSECCKTEDELLYSMHPKQYGMWERTIYLIGPCIVAGVSTAEVSSIAYMLHQKLVGQNIKYSIMRICGQKSDISLLGELKAIDLRENDIIIFITDSCEYTKENDDLDLLEDYNCREIDGCWWFLDSPIHSLRHGNEMIVNKLYPLIKEKYEAGMSENQCVQIGEPFLTSRQRVELQNYIDMSGIQKADNLCVGCIVMNANPFTKGHLYLAERAAQEVDMLLIFVVEEDLSEFSFSDRFHMVERGVQHINNVRVIPSGSFILSRHTFVSYFEKDKKQDERVDAALDIQFFGAYIVPAFGINKRFVGEEPKDLVTRQYNEEMKSRLPLYGVEVIEIPREKVNEMYISATVARDLYQEKDWNALNQYLPSSTMEYLSKNVIEMRRRIKLIGKQNIPECVTSRVDKILSEHGKVVFYGMGTDGRGLYSLVKDKDKVILCDKRAVSEKMTIGGRQVYEPSTLLRKFSGFPVVITSTRFGREIYMELVQMGIASASIIQNLYSFWT